MLRQFKLILVLLLLCPALVLSVQSVKADTPEVTATEPTIEPSVSILDTIKTLPLKEGVMYDFKNRRFLNTLGFGLITYKNFGLDVSYIGVDGVGATLEYNLSGLPVQNVPVLNYLAYLNIGYSVGYRTLTLNDVSGNPKSDNQFIQGPTVFLKFKF